MSQIDYEEITLDELVQRSSHIVLAHRDQPPQRVQPVAFDPADLGGRSCPPFEMGWARWVVESVILSPRNWKRTRVELAAADWQGMLEGHVAYHVQGLSESPIYFSYNAPEPPTGERAIVFACEDSGVLRLAVSGALEAPERLAEIQALLRKPPSREDEQVGVAMESTPTQRWLAKALRQVRGG